MLSDILGYEMAIKLFLNVNNDLREWSGIDEQRSTLSIIIIHY